MNNKVSHKRNLLRWGVLTALSGFLLIAAGLVSFVPPLLGNIARVCFAAAGAVILLSVVVDIVRVTRSSKAVTRK